MAPLTVGLAIVPSDSVQETQVVGAGERADCLPYVSIIRCRSAEN